MELIMKIIFRGIMTVSISTILVVVSLITLFIALPEPPITVTLRREYNTSWMDIESIDEEVFRQLQHKGKSYYRTKDYLYTYGSTGFVYIDLKNANVYIVLNEHISEDDRRFITGYLTINRKNLKHYFPEIKFIKKEDLDPEKYKIMMRLENEEIPYPQYDIISIHKDIR